MPRNNYLYTGQTEKFARELRKNMTPQEKKLWFLFLREYPVRFYRQRRIDNYIVDFYCASSRLAIELDGGQHFEEDKLITDAARTKVLNDKGILVIRFTNTQINNEFQAVCKEIDRIVKERTPQSATLTAPL